MVPSENEFDPPVLQYLSHTKLAESLIDAVPIAAVSCIPVLTEPADVSACDEPGIVVGDCSLTQMR